MWLQRPINKKGGGNHKQSRGTGQHEQSLVEPVAKGDQPNQRTGKKSEKPQVRNQRHTGKTGGYQGSRDTPANGKFQ